MLKSDWRSYFPEEKRHTKEYKLREINETLMNTTVNEDTMHVQDQRDTDEYHGQ